jgi:predicted aspartyl protease
MHNLLIIIPQMKTRFLFSAALLIIAQVAHAQNINLGGPASKNFYIELPYQQLNGKIIIEAEVNGSKKKFLLDTGAPDMIDPDVAAALGIGIDKTTTLSDAYNNTETTAISYKNTIKLGDVSFVNVPALIKPAGILSCFGAVGIVGSNLLRNTIIQFNAAKKVLVITDDAGKLHLNGQNAIPLNLKVDKQSSPYINATMGGKVSKQFEFDSGDGGFIEISNNYMRDYTKAGAAQLLATGYGSHAFSANGAQKEAARYRLKFAAMQVGPATFTNVITETAANSTSTGNRIGVKLLDYGIVTIDYLHSKFYFDPAKPSTDLIEKTWSLSPTFADDKLIIGLVWDKLSATVKPGAQIIAIDGVPCEHIEICSLITQPSILNGKEHATLTLRDEQGALSKLEIVKE